MAKLIVVLSGKVGAGKSTLANALSQKFGAHELKTHEVISAAAGERIKSERGELQRFGELLDRRTKGEWVARALTRFVEGVPDDAMVVVDSARRIEQVHAIRRSYGPIVYHIHLEAALPELERRYRRKQREKGFKEFSSYAEVTVNKTESRVNRLSETADAVIQTDRCEEEDVLVRAAACLGLFGNQDHPCVDVVVGGAYGSEGKGHICAYIAPEYDLLIRVGGPNAGHKVFEDPEPYTHHQLPSGTRRSKANLMIGPGAVINVPKLLREISQCNVSSKRLCIDPQAMVIDTVDQEYESSTLVKDIGSTGQGVGAATARKIMRGAEGKPVCLAKDIAELKPFIHETGWELENAFAQRKRVLIEGTQGTGLSLHHGHYPHVTSRDTTVAGCLSEVGVPPCRVRKVLIVCRTYPIRVQSPSEKRTSGYMMKELNWKEIATRSGYSEVVLRDNEITSTTGRKRRVGEFDWQLYRRAVALNGPTDIALTFADYVDIKNARARRFEQLTPATIQFIQELERVASAPVSLISTRFQYRSIIDRRKW